MRTYVKAVPAMLVDMAQVTRAELLKMAAAHAAEQLAYDCQDIRPLGYRITIEAYETEDELPWKAKPLSDGGTP